MCLIPDKNSHKEHVLDFIQFTEIINELHKGSADLSIRINVMLTDVS